MGFAIPIAASLLAIWRIPHHAHFNQLFCRHASSFKTATCCVACSPEDFCDFCSSDLPGDLAFKNGGDFGEHSVVSVSQEPKHKKSSNNSGKIWSKLRCEIRDEHSEFQEFGAISCCNFSDLTCGVHDCALGAGCRVSRQAS